MYYSFDHEEYAGSGSTCCYSEALITVNESLTISSKKNSVNTGHFTKFMVYDASINIASLGVVPDVPKGFTQIDFYDSLLNLEMYRRFYYDTTIVGGMSIIGYAQKDNSKYLLLTARLNAKSYLGIQKLDSSWNTIYTKILTPVPPDSINPFPNWNAKIGVSNNGNLIIAGFYRHLGITGLSYFLSELDGAGNVLHSYRSIEDTTYICAIDIDTLSGTALFVRTDFSSSVPKLQLERQFPSSPACNFVPFPMAPTSITITDLLFVSSVTTTINLLPVLNTVGAITPVNLSKIAIPLCGILSGTQGIQPDENCQTISTYAENRLYNFKPEENCYFNSGSELIIYNMYAQLVLKKRVHHTSDALNLDLSMLPSGIYLVKVEFENHNIGTSKFYKN
ncbi:MAG: T9SS type A sorting domain-containing protein [Bacteroidetes bacterium]|nr:T9SS type A sorting domain-containing protein [Bacteroidota bacterium]